MTLSVPVVVAASFGSSDSSLEQAAVEIAVATVAVVADRIHSVVTPGWCSSLAVALELALVQIVVLHSSSVAVAAGTFDRSLRRIVEAQLHQRVDALLARRP